MTDFLRHLRQAFRQARKSPGFTATVVGTLALGLGATTAMFTVVDRVMLRPLPYEDPAQLVKINETGRRGPRDGVAFLDLEQWRVRSHSIEKIAFYTPNNHVAFLQGTTDSVQVVAPKVSANLFATLGVSPALGRVFSGSPDNLSVRSEDANTIVLSDVIWRNVYGRDRNILGKQVTLNGDPYVVIGVMPRGFTFPFGGAQPVVWRSAVLGPEDTLHDKHVAPTYAVIGRLRAHVTLASAETELREIQKQILPLHPDPYDREGIASVAVQRYRESLIPVNTKETLFALLGAAALLWLISCVNVTSLLLARATSRQREIALCGALGASRSQLTIQFLQDGLVLSAAACCLGLLFARLTVQFFNHALTTQFNLQADLTPDRTVIIVLLVLTLLTAVIASGWPALAATSGGLQSLISQSSAQTGTSKSHHRTRSVLVVSEIALSLMLLTACGLLLRTVYKLRHVPLGFRTDHIVVANMTIPAYKFEGKDIRSELYRPLLDRVQHLPGVQSAALMTEVPLGKTFKMIFTFAARGNSAAAERQRNVSAQFRAVSPEMQRVFGFQMRAGRFFNEQDTAASQPVVVVNGAFVKAFFGETQGVNQILGQPLMNYGKNRPAVVIGVLDDERQVSVADQSQPEIEVCIPQITPDSTFYQATENLAMDLAVRTERSPSSIVPELRRVMRERMPELAASKISSMGEIVEDSYGSQHLAAQILEIFASFAVFLCVAGIYGMLSYVVAQRTREFGVRIALGAARADLVRLVLRKAIWMLIAGSGAGLVLSCFSAILLRPLLYGVRPQDPWNMLVVSILLIGIGLTACVLPARRAAKVDPMVALRYE